MSIAAESFLSVIEVITRLTPTLLGGLIAIVISAVPILIDSAREHWRKQFRKQTKGAILRGDLSYEDLLHIAERWKQDRNSILNSFRIMLSDALSGEDEALSEKAEALRSLLIEHQSREPYAELPENISIQLARIAEQGEASKASVNQLAASLGELYSKNQRDSLKQKRYTVWGFAVGVVGVLLAVLGLYYTAKP